MNTWHINTWGGGTPHYLVSAPTKEEAWQMVEKEWRKLNISYYVGGDYYNRTDKHQTIDDLIYLPGLTTVMPVIVDLNEDWKKQKSNNLM